MATGPGAFREREEASVRGHQVNLASEALGLRGRSPREGQAREGETPASTQAPARVEQMGVGRRRGQTALGVDAGSRPVGAACPPQVDCLLPGEPIQGRQCGCFEPRVCGNWG